nr:PREDICTED: tumor necrosis factor ligand superfamily member 13 [Latimeria chalumnae]|eukprot:XP_005999827.1 PREDICTED: tumor necrosis factor ligand superfamily member 13 [Latimeria chalumnae]
MAKCRPRGRERVSQSSVAMHLTAGSLLGTFTCLVVLVYQALQISNLQNELSQLKAEVLKDRDETESQSFLPVFTAAHPGGERASSNLREENPAEAELQSSTLSSQSRRAMRSQRRSREARRGRKRKRSMIHLAPDGYSSKENDDVTEIIWRKVLQQGPCFQENRKSVLLKRAGLYFIYSQVSRPVEIYGSTGSIYSFACTHFYLSAFLFFFLI